MSDKYKYFFYEQKIKNLSHRDCVKFSFLCIKLVLEKAFDNNKLAIQDCIKLMKEWLNKPSIVIINELNDMSLELFNKDHKDYVLKAGSNALSVITNQDNYYGFTTNVIMWLHELPDLNNEIILEIEEYLDDLVLKKR